MLRFYLVYCLQDMNTHIILSAFTPRQTSLLSTNKASQFKNHVGLLTHNLFCEQLVGGLIHATEDIYLKLQAVVNHLHERLATLTGISRIKSLACQG
jgi:hypothetical protein